MRRVALIGLLACACASARPAGPHRIDAHGLALTLPDGFDAERDPLKTPKPGFERFHFDDETGCRGELDVAAAATRDAHAQWVDGRLIPGVEAEYLKQGLVLEKSQPTASVGSLTARVHRYVRFASAGSFGTTRMVVDAWAEAAQRSVVLLAYCPSNAPVDVFFERLAHVGVGAP